MPDRRRRHSWWTAGLLLGMFAAAAAARAAAPEGAAGEAGAKATPPGLTGDWGGLRTRLAEDGITPTGSYVSESAWNFAGGRRERVRETGQFVFGAKIDTEALAGIRGGTLQASLTYRRGQTLGEDGDLGVLQQVQEVYGRAQTWRVTQLWYQQQIGPVDLKLGRMTMGEDFASFSCTFMNLTFCGAPPGNLVGDYWYNWPVSQWAVRLRLRAGGLYGQTGLFEVNSENLERDFSFGTLHGAEGVLVPAELGWTPALGPAGLPGSYRIGAWFSSADAPDLYLDIDHEPAALTGRPARERSGRYGAYAQLQQQVSGSAKDGKPVRGMSLFLNVTQADRHTSRLDRQIALGAFYAGPFAARPEDEIGIALGRTNVNLHASRTEELLAPEASPPHAEYAAEIYYGIQATPWLLLRPNLQYVVDPGGFRHADSVGVLGLKAEALF